jgi:hypothetical protein
MKTWQTFVLLLMASLLSSGQHTKNELLNPSQVLPNTLANDHKSAMHTATMPLEVNNVLHPSRKFIHAEQDALLTAKFTQTNQITASSPRILTPLFLHGDSFLTLPPAFESASKAQAGFSPWFD